ncbi:uncharacterized protein LOC130677400 [Microplitis mediator]|uniref:uncharacterized protein LOC130677400 n=1 Tax=Microplitis mediator TaxID=375433 RepID=UPI002557BA58|nr:uncharacterized protein LOC130677400 [Microplitis mediator]
MTGIIYFILCLIIVNVTKCNDIRINFLAPDSSNSHIHTKQLLELCFADQLNPVVISANLIDIVAGITKNEIIDGSVVVIDNKFSSKNIEKHYPRYPTYVLSADPIDTLKKILDEIKSSDIWNIQSWFLIIGTKCQAASKVLKLLWALEVSSSFFICRHESKNETLVYTLNPFTNYAPKIWTQVEMIEEPKDRMTLYSQPFVNDKEICQSLKFDKTKFLDGFPITGVGFGLEKNVSIGKVRPELFKFYPSINYYFFQNLMSVSNSTLVMYTDPHALVFNGTYDLQIPFKTLKFVNNEHIDFMAFYNQEGYVILTKKQKTIPIVNQITDNFFNYQTVTMSCIILTLILIAFCINSNFHLRLAFLDMLSLVLNMGIRSPLNRLPIRITFFCASIFMLIFNPALQGQIASMLTRPARENVETLHDLYKNKFDVYYPQRIHEEILNTKIWSNDSDKQYLHKSALVSYPYCEEIILKNPSFACVIYSDFLPDKLHDDLHLSKNVYFNEYDVVVSRKNWGLKNKLDKVAMNFFETGQWSYVEKRSLFKRLLRMKRLTERIEKAKQYDQLDFGWFEFDYILVGLSVLWTVIVLVIEIMISKITKAHKRHLRKLKLRKFRVRRKIAFIVREMAEAYNY